MSENKLKHDKQMDELQKIIENKIASFNRLANNNEHDVRLCLWPIQGELREALYDGEPDSYYIGFRGGEDEMLDMLYMPDVPEGWVPSRFCY